MSNRNIILAAAGGAPSGPVDPNFNQTVLLLHGDGTNGAQNNTFLDSSTNNFTITRNGNVTQGSFSPFSRSSGNLVNAPYDPAVHGGSGYFDASADYLSFANDADFSFSGDFCVEAWYYYVGNSGDAAIISISDASNDGFCGFSHTRLLLRQDDGTTIWDYTSYNLTQNVWSHLAVTRSGTTLRFFINGVQEATTTSSATIASSSTTGYIGSRLSSNGRGYNWGYIGPVRIVNGSAVYTAAFTPPTTPPTAIANTVLLLNFTNAGIFDNTGKTSLESLANVQIDTAIKKYGTGSIEFDGTGDCLVAPSSSNTILSGDFTVEMWAYRNSGNNAFFTVGDANTSTGVSLYIGNFGASLYVESNNSLQISSSLTTFPTTTWTHLALVRSAGSIKLYVAGTQVGSAWSSATTFSGNLYVGGDFHSSLRQVCDGYLDEFRITNGVARYTTTFTPPDAPFPDQ